MPSPVHPYSDYGVSLRTLRTARGWLGFWLLACVVWQFVGFALMYWTQQPYMSMRPEYVQQVAATAPVMGPATQGAVPFFPGTVQSRRLNVRPQWDVTYTMVVPVTQLCSLVAVSSQVIIVFITLLVMLVAQAPGVAQITRSLIWSVLLMFMFLPWQYFAREFPIPGVIYSYAELLRFIGPHVVKGEPTYPLHVWLVMGRFIVWPLVGLFVLLITGERYRAGIMIAIGHPLQSILQPRGVTAGPPVPKPAALTRG
jgi:hypothetical protein